MISYGHQWIWAGILVGPFSAEMFSAWPKPKWYLLDGLYTRTYIRCKRSYTENTPSRSIQDEYMYIYIWLSDLIYKYIQHMCKWRIVAYQWVQNRNHNSSPKTARQELPKFCSQENWTVDFNRNIGQLLPITSATFEVFWRFLKRQTNIGIYAVWLANKYDIWLANVWIVDLRTLGDFIGRSYIEAAKLQSRQRSPSSCAGVIPSVTAPHSSALRKKPGRGDTGSPFGSSTSGSLSASWPPWPWQNFQSPDVPQKRIGR